MLQLTIFDGTGSQPWRVHVENALESNDVEP